MEKGLIFRAEPVVQNIFSFETKVSMLLLL